MNPGSRVYRPGRLRTAGIVVVVAFCSALLTAQQRIGEESFLQPPQLIQDILNRDNHYDNLDAMGPDGDHFYITLDAEFSSFELMSQRTLRLGMLEICPDVNREWRLSTYGAKGLRIYSLNDRKFLEVKVPPNAFLSDMTWSPDGKRIAFLAHLKNGTQVWTADVATGQASALSDAWVMATLTGRPQRGGGPGRRPSASRMLQWLPDGSILTTLVPNNRGPEPREDPIPKTPIIRVTNDKPTPTPTYPFLLRTPHDKELFEYYTTSQLAVLAPGKAPRNIGSPAMYMDISLSPDGKYFLAEKIVEPLSYIIDYNGFAKEMQVLDLDGKVVSTVRKTPLEEAATTMGGGRRASDSLPRDVAWRPDGKGLYFLYREKRAEGGAEGEGEETPRKDRLMTLAAPFDINQAQVIATSDKTLSQASFSRDGRYAIASATGRGTGTRNRLDIIAYDMASGSDQPHYLARDVDPEDPLKLPGDVMTRATGNGIDYTMLSSDGSSAYLSGAGYREDFKPRPFIDRVRISDGGKQRVFEGTADFTDRPLVALDDDVNRLIVRRESKTAFPDSYLWTRDGTPTRLTNNRDPFPEVAAAEKVDFSFVRRDGLTVYGNITLPVGYVKGTRVPAVFWTYPREFANFGAYKKAAIRARNNNSYKQLDYRNASEIWLTQGYAVVVPDIPIIGADNTYNDNYVGHLVDTMYAAIRKLDDMGYIDPDRLGHGGHSYGGFTTGNILAHSPFFKAGIAGDAAYNRSLTPMTFQSERRNIWQAKSTYLEMSSFFYANNINSPILMYHGGSDNNTGTFLIQSERMFQALNGLGKKAVLYIYPFESHGPRCKETYLDMWARWLDWFNLYVKGEGKTGTGNN